MEVWGLTGGIASGKSTAARFFEAAGVPVIDADRVAASLSEPGGRAYDAIVAEFGTADRAELRKKVFNQPEQKKKLESILHPLIREESEAAFARRIEEETKKHGKPPKRILYEAALLVETGRYKELQGLVVVEAAEADRIERLIKRDGIDATLAQKMIAAQATDEERRAAATAVLFNRGSEAALKAAVESIIEQWATEDTTAR
jgi:dephospho-CoA kinase